MKRFFVLARPIGMLGGQKQSSGSVAYFSHGSSKQSAVKAVTWQPRGMKAANVWRLYRQHVGRSFRGKLEVCGEVRWGVGASVNIFFIIFFSCG